jgi:hypothetical protein
MLSCHFASLVPKAEGRDRDQEGSRAKPDIGATCRNLTEGIRRVGFHMSHSEKMEGTRDYHLLKCSCGEAEDLGTQSSLPTGADKMERMCRTEPMLQASRRDAKPLSRHKEGKAGLCKHTCSEPVLLCKQGCRPSSSWPPEASLAALPVSPYPRTSSSLCKAQGSLLFPTLSSHILSVLLSVWRSYQLMTMTLPLPAIVLLLPLACPSLGNLL